MDVKDHEHRRLIFINMKEILTPEEKQYLRRTSNYLQSMGMSADNMQHSALDIGALVL